MTSVMAVGFRNLNRTGGPLKPGFGLSGAPSGRVSLQERFEGGDEAVREINQLIERWEKGIRISNLRLVNRFVDFSLQISLRVVIKDSGKIYVRSPMPIGIVGPPWQPICKKQILMADGEQVAMLVRIIEGVDSPESIVSSLVRLGSIDGPFGFVSHSLYLSSLSGFICGKVLCDGKLNTTRVRRPVVIRSHHDKLICEMVEGASEVVHNIADGGKRFKGERRQGMEDMRAAGNWIRSVGVDVGGDYCKFTIPKFDQLPFQVTEVLLGPLDLNANENKAS